MINWDAAGTCPRKYIVILKLTYIHKPLPAIPGIIILIIYMLVVTKKYDLALNY